MRSTNKVILVALLLVSWVGCNGDASKSEPADCELVAGPVIYEDGKLVVDVTATVTDDSGNAVEKVLITVDSDRDNDSVEPAVGTTDASGQVEFQITTQEGGTATQPTGTSAVPGESTHGHQPTTVVHPKGNR